MLSQSPDVSRYDLSCLKILITGGGLLSATIRLEVMERIPTLKYVREAYGLNECGLAVITYPREKKNSVSGFSFDNFNNSNFHILIFECFKPGFLNLGYLSPRGYAESSRGMQIIV